MAWLGEQIGRGFRIPIAPSRAQPIEPLMRDRNVHGNDIRASRLEKQENAVFSEKSRSTWVISME